MNVRRVLTKNETGYIEVQEQPIPPLEPGTALVKVHASLISAGTEISRLRDRPRTPGGSQRVFGYQNAGIVLEVGEGCRNLTPGTRVACMGGPYSVHGEYAVVPQNLITPLPENVSYAEGAFIALAATAMQAVRRSDLVWGEEAAVLGLGIVGQLVAQICQIAGARVLAFDPLPLRVECARRAGVLLACTDTGEAAVSRVAAVTEGRGLDCAFLCVGDASNQVFPYVYKMMKRAPDTHAYGRVVSVGGTLTHGMGASLGNLDIRSSARTGPGYHDPEYEYGRDYPEVFVRWSTQAHIRLFARWVSEGRLNVKDLITTRVPLEKAPEACYSLMDEPERHLGVVILYHGEGSV